MSWIDKARSELDKHAIALEVIEGIAKLVKDALIKPESDLHAVLKAVERAVETLIKGFDGKAISREEIDKVIAAMTSRRVAMHAAIDQRLDDKFDGGGNDR